ncbi:MAG: hypothetical protein Q8R55_06420 [Candidatus Taylorbacteria bacterium]|nr:hypothetical protein [Candidatus Taylorbacteria bacterium]
MNKKMTIDTLARMTQDEFSRIGERFNDMDTRFDKMDGTLKTILDVVLDIPSKKAFERLDNKVQTFDARLTSVERKVK